MYPDEGRFWAIVDKYKVSKFYTAPTAIRMLMKFGNDPVKKYKAPASHMLGVFSDIFHQRLTHFRFRHSRQSLRVLGTVGEPINPEAWLWYHDVIGNGQCAIVDTFFQTETVGHEVRS